LIKPENLILIIMKRAYSNNGNKDENNVSLLSSCLKKSICSKIKSSIKILAILVALILSSGAFSKQASAQQPYVSLQVFYDELSPYGEWVNYRDYGYVWIPNEGPDFVPYSTGGHWIFTNYGWTWVSDYEWGWAPFHYGRWNYDNYYGWLWIPDIEWGPAWVNWRRADGYYGWSPMESGISLSMSFGRGYDRNNDHWMVVRDRDFERSDINRYYVNRTDHDQIFRNSTVISNTYIDNSRNTTYISGPAREDIQRVTGTTINPVVIQESNKPGQNLRNGQLSIYRPQVRKENVGGQKPAPTRIVNLNDVKSPSERNATTQPRIVNPQNNNMNNAQPTQPRNANPVTVKGRQQQKQQPQQQQKQPAQQVQRQQQPVKQPAQQVQSQQQPVKQPQVQYQQQQKQPAQQEQRQQQPVKQPQVQRQQQQQQPKQQQQPQQQRQQPENASSQSDQKEKQKQSDPGQDKKKTD
jgi:hypothetical protein